MKKNCGILLGLYILPFVLFLVFQFPYLAQAQKLRVAIAGLNHDHAYGIMNQYKNGEVSIIGIAEPDKQLAEKYKKWFQLPDSIFYADLLVMLNRIHPDFVLAYNAISDHISVVEACAPKGISVMVEKPLATTVEQVNRMAALAKQYHIQLLTNYETTWYPSNQQAYQIINDQKGIGEIRKMVVHSGHQGPIEIGCSPDFLAWLTDPVKNGGGAIMDFGCYGANLMTWLMNGQAPIAVTAVARHIKPQMYPKVDDDATILLEYPSATGIIEASWNWPFGIKDLEVFGQHAYLHAVNGNLLEQRIKDSTFKPNLSRPMYKNNLEYLAAVQKGQVTGSNDLSSLENNIIVVKILDAARRSVKEGKKIELAK